MTRGWLAVLALILAASCAAPGSSSRTQGDQDRDGKTIAAAIDSTDQGGAGFHMDETLTFTGGDIPSNQQLQVKATADGVARDGRARMTFKIATGNNRTILYDMVIDGITLYVKPHGATTWKKTPSAPTTALFPTMRLQLVRESVLLAKRVDANSITNSSGGFAHRYRVVPASDQLEQLQAIPVSGTQQEAGFLKTASGEIDAFLSLSGNRLQRLETHLSGKDPTNGEQQKVDCNVDFKTAKVAAIQPPAGAALVTPDQILNQI
jgi:hypothetical protein